MSTTKKISFIKNLIFLIFLFSFTSISLTAQVKVIPDERVGIGTTMPEESAKLDINSNDSGLLIPRFAYDAIFPPATSMMPSAIVNPADGLQVYLTSLDDDERGVYYYDGGLLQWIKIGEGANSAQDLSSNDTPGQIFISSGQGTVINVEDADHLITNELQTLSQSGNDITLSDGGGTITITDNVNDADFDPDNENQDLSTDNTLPGNISISNGNTIDINVDDADSEIDNELQTLSQNGNDITLSDGGGTVTITDNVNDADADPNNENQTVSAGTGVDVKLVGQNYEVINTAPDQVVNITGSGVSGTYPNFTIMGNSKWTDGSGTEIYRLGNVGIGISDPVERLQIGNAFTFHDGGHKLLGFNYGAGAHLDASKYAAEIRLDPVAGKLRFGTSADLVSAPLTRLTIDKNGNIGIGTVSPQSLLDVDGQVRIGGDLFPSFNSVWHTMIIGKNPHGDRASILFNPNSSSNDGMGIQYVSAVGGLQIVDWEGAQIRTTILKNGNVGINTDEPSAPLQIGNHVGTDFSSFDNYQVLLYQAGNSNNSYGLGIRGSTFAFNAYSAAQYDFDHGGVTTLALSSSLLDMDGSIKMNETSENNPTRVVTTTGDGVLKTTDLSIIAKETNLWTENNSEVHRLSNVGIGTSDPEYQLDINGGVRLGTSGNAGLILENYTGELAGIPAAGTDGGVQIQSGLHSKTVWDLRANDPRDGLFFRVPSTLELNPTMDKTAMAISPLGRVGIGGITEPIYPLHVAGDILSNWIRTSGNTGLYFQNRGGGLYMVDNTWIRTYGNKSFYHNTGTMRTDGIFNVGPNGNRFLVRTDGNVGIGLTNPSEKLHVNGNIKMTESDDVTPQKVVVTDGDGVLKTADLSIIADETNLWTDSSGEIFRSSNVGILNTNPAFPLDVTGRINSTSHISSGAGSGGVALTINDGKGNANVTFNHAGGVPEQNGNAGRIEVNTDANAIAIMDFELGGGVTGGQSTNLSNIMRLRSDGRVGIGTATPTTDLDVSGPMSANVSFTLGAHDDANRGIVVDNGASTAWNYLTLVNNNGNEIVATGTGRIGIGTTSPIYPLHVAGDILSNWIRTSGNTGLYFQSRGGGLYMVDNTWIRTYGNKSFYHNTGTMRTDGIFNVGPNGNRFLVRTDGNVGIGLTNPTEKLHVNGNIKMTETNESSPSEIVVTTGDGVLKTDDAGKYENLWLENVVGEIYRESNVRIGSKVGVISDPLEVIGRISPKFPQWGSTNIAIGTASGNEMPTIPNNNNLIVGVLAGNLMEGSSNNQIFGTGAGREILNSDNNNLIGRFAGQDISNSDFNNIIGNSAGANSNGADNNIIGHWAGIDNDGDENTIIGYEAGRNNISNGSILIGTQAGINNEGNESVIIGAGSGFTNKGNHNVILGAYAAKVNTGNNNVFIGLQAGEFHSSGWDNVLLGKNTSTSSYSGNGISIHSSVALGSNSKANASNSVAIGNNAEVIASNVVYLKTGSTSTGKVETDGYIFQTSDSRFKSSIQEDVPGLAFISRLKPVSYNFENLEFEKHRIQTMPDSIQADHLNNFTDSDVSTKRLIGFLAQDVESICSDLNFEFRGLSKPDPNNPATHYSISYSQFVMPLVKAVQEQQDLIEKQETKIEALIQEAEDKDNLLEDLLRRVESLERG